MANRVRIESEADEITLPRGYRSTLLPVVTTGVKGDAPSHELVLFLSRAGGVYNHLNEEVYREIDNLSNELTRNIRGINRVALDITKRS